MATVPPGLERAFWKRVSNFRFVGLCENSGTRDTESRITDQLPLRSALWPGRDLRLFLRVFLDLQGSRPNTPETQRGRIVSSLDNEQFGMTLLLPRRHELGYKKGP